MFTGIKILPDPHHKPRKYQKKSNGNDSSKKDKNDATSSNKPEYIALSSDEEPEDMDGESHNSVQENIDEMNEGVQEVVVVAADDNVDQEEQSKKVCFFKAASQGDFDMLKNMVENGFKDIDQFQDEYDKMGEFEGQGGQPWPMTPLQASAFYGHVEVTEYLIEIGADMEKTDHHSDQESQVNSTALLLATFSKLDGPCYGHDKVIKVLLQNGAKVNFKGGWFGDFGQPIKRPLDLAIEYYDETLIKLFFQYGANEINQWNDLIIALFHKLEVPLSSVIDTDGNTLFHFAVAQKRPEEVKLMLQDGTQTYLKNHAGRTPFHQAAGESTLEIVKLLYFNDNQTNLRDEKGSTPLHYAVENGKLDIATFLFQNGASLNLKDSSGRTPLHYAAKLKTNPRESNDLPLLGKRSEEIEIIEFLLQSGALVNSKDSFGRTPLHDVAEKGSLEVVKLLLQKGAEISSSDSEGKTPLQIAINSSSCQQDVWEYLMEKQKENNPTLITDIKNFRKTHDYECLNCEKQFFLQTNDSSKDKIIEVHEQSSTSADPKKGIKRKVEGESIETETAQLKKLQKKNENKIKELNEKLEKRNSELTVQMAHQNELMDWMDIPKDERSFSALQDAFINLKRYYGKSMWKIISFKQRDKDKH